ncbi:MAG: FHA domain-containing protein [Planctomycetota bacterium]
MVERTRIIGRSRSADLVIPSSRVSRRHCSVIPSGDGFVLQDHDSRNGVWVEGQRVKTAFLKHGASFAVAGYRIRIARDGELVLEGETDPAKMLFREKISKGTPALVTFLLTICCTALYFFFNPLVFEILPESSIETTIDSVELWTPQPKENSNQSSSEEAKANGLVATDDVVEPESSKDAWNTASGREWTLDELLALAEAIEATDQESVDSEIATAVVPALEPVLDPAEIVIPESANPWAEVARLRKDGKSRRRRARSRVVENPLTDSSITRVASDLDVNQLLEMGREALSSYHIPADVMAGFRTSLETLRDMRSEEAWAALDILRKEARDLLRHVASRAREIGSKYGHLDRNFDAPLAPKERREAELALNLLVLIQEQMEILLQARDVAFETLADPGDPEMLSFALSVALEDDDEELLDVVLALGVDQKPDELLPVLIKGLKVPSATRKLKVRAALQKITGESYRSVSEWQRWLIEREER